MGGARRHRTNWGPRFVGHAGVRPLPCTPETDRVLRHATWNREFKKEERKEGGPMSMKGALFACRAGGVRGAPGRGSRKSKTWTSIGPRIG